MKRVLIIFYWIVSILLLAFVLISFGYRFMESLFIATLFLPGALAVKYIFPKILSADKSKNVANAIYVTIGVIIAEILLFFIAHWCVLQFRAGDLATFGTDYGGPPEIMYNPAFIAIMIAALALGNYFFEKWLYGKYPSEEKPVNFLSERKPISLARDEILYVESNDSVTTVYAAQSRSFKNKTPISQWEDFLGEGFLRIHRSYLVNIGHITGHDSESVTIDDGTELPVSRKYRDAVKHLI